jgi:outer membrane protein assembly factor BamB
MKRRKLNKKILLGSLIPFLLSSTFVFVIAGEKQKKVEVKLLWQKQLDANIKDIAIAEEEVKPGVVKHEFVVVTDKGVKVLDKDGNVLWEREGYAFVSKQGKYVGIKETTIDENRQYKSRFTLLNKKGEIISEFPITEYNATTKDGVLISDFDGSVLIWGTNLNIYPSWGPIRLTFYNKFGTKIKEISSLWSNSQIQISKNGKYIVLIAAGLDLKKKKLNTPFYLYLLTYNGEEKWKREVAKNNEYNGSEVILSDKGDFIAGIISKRKYDDPIASSCETLLYNKEGQLISVFNQNAIRPLKFSPGRGIYLIGAGGVSPIDELYLFNTKTGKLLWKYSNSSNIYPEDLTEELIIAYSKQSNILLFDLQGNKIFELSLPSSQNKKLKKIKIRFINGSKKFVIIDEINVGMYEIFENK